MSRNIIEIETHIPGNSVHDLHEWLAAFPGKSDIQEIHYVQTEEGTMKIGVTIEGCPPSEAVYLLYFFLSKKSRDLLLGDLQEEYLEIYLRFGAKPANIWFWKQVFMSLCPLWNGWLAKYGAKLGEWGKGVIAEAIKRRMS